METMYQSHVQQQTLHSNIVRADSDIPSFTGDFEKKGGPQNFQFLGGGVDKNTKFPNFHGFERNKWYILP